MNTIRRLFAQIFKTARPERERGAREAERTAEGSNALAPDLTQLPRLAELVSVTTVAGN